MQLGPVSILFVPVYAFCQYDPRTVYESRCIAEWKRLGLTIDQYYSHQQNERTKQYATRDLAEVDGQIESLKGKIEVIPVKTKRFAWATALATCILTPIRTGIALASDAVKVFVTGAGSGNSVTLKSNHREKNFGWEIGLPAFPGKTVIVQAGVPIKVGGFSAFGMVGPEIATNDQSGASVGRLIATAQIGGQLPFGRKVFSVQEWAQPLRRRIEWQYFTDNVLTCFARWRLKGQVQFTAIKRKSKAFAWRYGPRLDHSFGNNHTLSLGWLWNGNDMAPKTLDLKLVYSF